MREFRIELERLSAASAEGDGVAEKDLAQLRRKIDRIVDAIAGGTDTPSLRDALLRFETEKSGLEQVLAGRRRRAVPTGPNVDLETLFRGKVEGLERALASDAVIRVQASAVFRTMIDRIVLRPGRRRGSMSVEVHGDPSALFLMAQGADANPDDRMIKMVAEERFRRNHPLVRFKV